MLRATRHQERKQKANFGNLACFSHWRSAAMRPKALLWGFHQQMAAVYYSNWTTWAAFGASLGSIKLFFGHPIISMYFYVMGCLVSCQLFLEACAACHPIVLLVQATQTCRRYEDFRWQAVAKQMNDAVETGWPRLAVWSTHDSSFSAL